MTDKYRVWLRSKPGHWAAYDGHIDVYADSREAAEWMAKRKLQLESFPERRPSDWKVEKVEIL